MRATLAQAIDPSSRIAESLGLAPGDSRVLSYINRSIQRLMHRGHWIGTMDKYSVSVSQSLLTLPPQFAVAEQLAINNRPMDLHSPWFEWNPGGWGTIGEATATQAMPFSKVAIQRGNACTITDIPVGASMQLRLQCDVAADVGAQVLLLGYDGNGNWIRTNPGGIYQDGLLVTLAQTPGTLTTFNASPIYFSRITGVQKPLTNGQIWLYTWDGTNNVMIGNYQFWETNPFYARYVLPTCPSTTNQVDIYGKMAWRPVINPTDWLILGNLEAIRLACMALRAEECQKWDDAAIYMNGGALKGGQSIDGAVPLLQYELQHELGDGYVPEVRVEMGAWETPPTLL